MASSDNKPYLTATVLNQDFLDECADNMTNQIEMICDIQLPDGSICHASDRNKYVGTTFYEALIQFPVVERTLGEWLSPQLEFSTLSIELSNADGRFNKFLPAGDDYGAWIGRSIIVKIGLRDVASTYFQVFKGYVTDVGGAKRTTYSIKLIARNEWDRLNIKFPRVAFTTSEFPFLENDKEGKLKPIVLGNWTTGLTSSASVPAIIVNGNNPNVFSGVRLNVQTIVSVNALSSILTARVYLRRNNNLYQFVSTDIVSVTSFGFSIVQNGATFIGSSKYYFETGDEFFVQCNGPTLGGYLENIVAQARYLLETYGGLTAGDFDTSWNTYRDKAAPAQSAIASIKARAWIGEQQELMQYVLSMLEQVRLECFVNQQNKLTITSMHFEDWNTRRLASNFMLKNWDIEKNTFEPSIDEVTNFNRIQASYNYEPIVEENSQATKIYRNNAAIIQANGKEIFKQIVFPNLYLKTDVENQMKEILKLSSAYFEMVPCKVTWRFLLRELGDVIGLNVQIGSSIFDDVPCMVRSIGYDPIGMKLEVKLMSFQMVNYPGWEPGYSGIIGGYDATITAE